MLRRKRSARMVNTHSPSPVCSQRASMIRQLFVFTSVCSLLKLVKSV